MKYLMLWFLVASSVFAEEKTLYEVREQKGGYYTRTFIEIKGETPTINDLVNQQIASVLNLRQEPCDQSSDGSFNSALSTIDYRPGVLLSFKAISQTRCQASAAVSKQKQGLVFDLTTGKRISMASQFVDDDPSLLDRLLFDHIRRQRTALGPPEKDDCLTHYKDRLPVAGFILEGEYLVVWSESPPQLWSCDVELSIPLSALSHSLKPGSFFDRVFRNQR